MSRSTRRYTLSAKRRRRSETGREDPFWGSQEADLLSDGVDGVSNIITTRDRHLNSPRRPKGDKDAKLAPTHRLRHVVKRQEEGNDGNEDSREGEVVPEIINEVVEGVSPGVTVTVSIGVDIQLTTVSTSGSTFVSLSTSMFTLDSTGGVSTAPITPTAPLPITPDVSIPLPTPPPIVPTGPLPSQTPATTPIPVPGPISSELSPPQDRIATDPITTISSLLSSLGANMTDHRRIMTTTKDRTVLLYPATSNEGWDSTKTASSSERTEASTAISVSTVVPVNGDPTPPPSPTVGADTESGGSTETITSVPASERLPPILGGVFGGLAGIGLVLWALLYLLRKRRRNLRGAGNFAISRSGHQRALSHETTGSSYGVMSQNRSSIMYNIFGRSSAETPLPPSEQGFQKISGYKLPSQYGPDMIPASMMVAKARASASDSGSRNVSGGTYRTVGGAGSTRGSSYQDDDVPTNSVLSPFSSNQARTAMRTGSPALASRIPEHEPDDDLLIQTSPHQTPFSDQAESSTRFPTPPPGAIRRMQSLIGADGVGRSLASQDGSKTSRFTEDV